MRTFFRSATLSVVFLFAAFGLAPRLVSQPGWQSLFNGRNLSGWVPVNGEPGTWRVEKGEIVSTGLPIGVMRSERQYENFLLEVDWMHTAPGGNSGMFLWSDAIPGERNRLPNGIEVQMLDHEWVTENRRPGFDPPIAYVQGELFGVGGVRTIPDNPRGERSKALRQLTRPRWYWNHYTVVAVDGTVKLAVNGTFVNGLSHSTKRRGYLCLEAEGAEIHFKNLRILELPPSAPL
ncbi:MAG: DUF1080 domain-containing protein [Bryobacter sp.]|nr:DUF1080 domain-containing protein [Bryobacter sp.]